MSEYVKIASVSDLPPGQGKIVAVQGREIALFNLNGSYCAIDNTCTHAGGPLGEGMLEGEEVECPWHGARFNVKTGAVCNPPADEGVTAYKVRVNGSDIEIEL